jgi:hypothetical protein
MRQHFDFLIMADPRLAEADCGAFAGLLEAMLERGSSVGLLSVLGPLADQRRFLPRALAELLRDGRVRWPAVPGPVDAEILLVYHLSPLLADPDRITRIAATRCFLRVERPLDERIDLAAVLERLRWFCPQQPGLLATDDAVLASLQLQAPGASPAGSLPRAAIDADGSSVLAAVQPPPVPAAPQLRVRAIEQAKARVLMVSPNGVGIGHLTRQLAIARRLPTAVEPLFFSMSQAVHLVERFGMGWTYAPGPSASGVAEERRWTTDFAQRLVDTVAFLDPRVIVFDGNHPYQALRDARQHFSDRPFVWIRRGMWRADAGWPAIERSDMFDVIVEPGELATTMDVGLTKDRGDALLLPPVTLLDPGELLSREAARAALAIPPDATAVLVQLGSGNNFDMLEVRRTILEHCARLRDCHVRLVRWPISAGEPDDSGLDGHRFRALHGFPLARLVRGFDFAVSAAGYNSFHELTAYGVPAIFVPNQNPMMDEQEARALYADRQGIGLMARANDLSRLSWALEAMGEPRRLTAMRERMVRLPTTAGAQQAASFVAMLALSINASGDGPRIPSLQARW